jgi:hypothetical protein
LVAQHRRTSDRIRSNGVGCDNTWRVGSSDWRAASFIEIVASAILTSHRSSTALTPRQLVVLPLWTLTLGVALAATPTQQDRAVAASDLIK